jgi:predicted MFS family arabinose efflux permease
MMTYVSNTPDDDRATYGDIFRVREFSALFAAHVASMLGNIVADVALMVLVYQRTHSPALAASTMSLLFLPYLFGGSVLSSAAQRWRSRRTLIVCDLTSAAIVAVMALPHLPVAAILVLLFALGLIAPVFGGVRSATLTQVLPAGAPYVLGRSVLRLVAQGAQVVGFAIGGLLLIAFSARDALLVDVGSFLLSALLLRLGTLERRPTREPTHADVSVVRESLRNLREVFAVRRLRRIMLLEWLLPTCAVAPEALAAPYVARLGAAPHAVGFWLTAIPIGTVLSDIVAARLLSARRRRIAAVPAMALMCLPLLSFAAQPSFAVAFALLVVLGLGNGYQPALDQELVAASPAKLLGAALSISGSGLMFCQGAGYAVWGVLAEFIAPPAVIGIAGGLAALVVVTLRPWPGWLPPLAARAESPYA